MPRKADRAMDQKVQQEIAASVHQLADTVSQGGGASREQALLVIAAEAYLELCRVQGKATARSGVEAIMLGLDLVAPSSVPDRSR